MIDELIERVRGLSGPDKATDDAIKIFIAGHMIAAGATAEQVALTVGGSLYDPSPAWIASLDAAVALVKRVLPGWGYRVATCCVSDDAWLFPDYNDPVHGERLKREVSEDIDWIEITDIDLRPPGREPIALILSLLAALSALKAKEARDGR